MVQVAASHVSSRRKLVTNWGGELERLAVRTVYGIGHRVEGEVACKRHRHDELRRCQEGVSGWICVVASTEIAIVTGNDRVGFTLEQRQLTSLVSPRITFWTSVLSQDPQHGPHALDRTLAPSCSKHSIWPSLAMVARIASLPGETMSGAFGVRPAPIASLAIAVHRERS